MMVFMRVIMLYLIYFLKYTDTILYEMLSNLFERFNSQIKRYI
jgi:hypothetical protein